MRGRTASSVASALRLWNGALPAERTRCAPRPRLTLYEYEASPWCRRVRETLCILDLEAEVHPCPRSTLRVEGTYSATSAFKPEVRRAGGRLLFPFLIDHTAGVALNQSAAIVEHLWTTYADHSGTHACQQHADHRENVPTGTAQASWSGPPSTGGSTARMSSNTSR